MVLEVLNINHRFLNTANILNVTVAGSKETSDNNYEIVKVDVTIERATQDDLFALTFGEIREEALVRAKSLISVVG